MNRFRIPFAIAAMIALPSTAGLAAVRPAGVLFTSPAIAQHSYSGTLQSRRHLVLTIRLRNGQLVLVDATPAYLNNKVSARLVIGEPLLSQGTLIAGVLIASSVAVTTSSALRWAPDR